MRIELLGRRFLFKSWNVKGGALKSKLSPLTTTTLISMKRRRGSFSIPSIEIFSIKLRQTSSWLLCKVHKKSGHFPGENIVTHWAETLFFYHKIPLLMQHFLNVPTLIRHLGLIWHFGDLPQIIKTICA